MSYTVNDLPHTGFKNIWHLICEMCQSLVSRAILSLCHQWCTHSEVKVTRAHISHSVSSAISDNHSFLTPPPVSCNAFFLFSFFICTSPISWCLQLPLHIFSLSSDFFYPSFSPLNGYLCLAFSGSLIL